LNHNINILVLVSGGGTNLQALIDAQKEQRLLNGRIAAVVSDRRNVFALERARAAGIPARVEEPDSLSGGKRQAELSDRILCAAQEYNTDLVVLAGFLSILAGEIISVYEGRIINLHPALLPRYGGRGMYGDRVHAAVLAAGESESGCTVHLVDAGTDTGPILLQRRVPVLGNDTIETLSARIHHEEHIAIVEAAVMMIQKLSGDFK
jgi:phosphoribosylglycinamide formyltransferase-1